MNMIVNTEKGQLYQQDCLEFLYCQESESVDLAFADPPFNLAKKYESGMNDSIGHDVYLEWCYEWLQETVRTLKPGGSLYIWNLPKWNIPIASYLNNSMTFRNWISVAFKCGMPIRGRLRPDHYSLLYFVKGDKPSIFTPDKLPIQCCRHCGGENKDYGGHKDKLNPEGLMLSDVWDDISPVMHNKNKNRGSNALPIKLMDRILSISSEPGSLVMDTFGGSGTTFVTAELKGRNWIGCELDCTSIVERFNNLDRDKELLEISSGSKNILFKDSDLKTMEKSGYNLSSRYRRK